MKWTTQSDSALQLIDERAAGNSVLPKTRQAYQAVKRQAIQTYQLLVRGGMMARDWLRMEIKSGEWGLGGRVPGAQAGTPLGESPPGEPPSSAADTSQLGDGRGTRCGAHDAHEVTKRLRIAQEVYDSKMEYAETTQEIEILLSY